MDTTGAPLAQRYADLAAAWISQAGYDGPIRFVKDAPFRGAVLGVARANRAMLDVVEDSYATRGRRKNSDARFEAYREVEALAHDARAALDREAVAILEARAAEAERRARTRFTRI